MGDAVRVAFHGLRQQVSAKASEWAHAHHNGLAHGHDPSRSVLWMIQQLEEAKNFLRDRGLLRGDMDHAALDPQFWFGVLSVDPTTVPQGKDFYSTMTMLTFKSWNLRSAFLSR